MAHNATLGTVTARHSGRPLSLKRMPARSGDPSRTSPAATRLPISSCETPMTRAKKISYCGLHGVRYPAPKSATLRRCCCCSGSRYNAATLVCGSAAYQRRRCVGYSLAIDIIDVYGDGISAERRRRRRTLEERWAGRDVTVVERGSGRDKDEARADRPQFLLLPSCISPPRALLSHTTHASTRTLRAAGRDPGELSDRQGVVRRRRKLTTTAAATARAPFAARMHNARLWRVSSWRATDGGAPDGQSAGPRATLYKNNSSAMLLNLRSGSARSA